MRFSLWLHLTLFSFSLPSFLSFLSSSFYPLHMPYCHFDKPSQLSDKENMLGRMFLDAGVTCHKTPLSCLAHKSQLGLFIFIMCSVYWKVLVIHLSVGWKMHVILDIFANITQSNNLIFTSWPVYILGLHNLSCVFYC